MSERIKIIIADDHPIFRSGLKQLLDKDESIQVVGEADNGIKALELIKEKTPDIAILDIDMPGKTGLEVMKEIREIEIKVIFLTMYAEEDIFDEAINLGAKGYVLKDSAVDDIIECIRTVEKDEYYLSPSVSNFLVSRRKRINELKKSNPSLDKLTATEKRILKFISENKTSREIADKLYLSVRTIENHRTNISSKLNLKGSHSLLKFAIENKSLLSTE